MKNSIDIRKLKAIFCCLFLLKKKEKKNKQHYLNGTHLNQKLFFINFNKIVFIFSLVCGKL